MGPNSYELLLENAPDATLMINADGEVRYLNLRAELLFLYKRDELIGQPLEVLIPERYRTVHRSHRANYAKAPRPRMMGVHIKHLTGLCKDGREFPAEISLSPLPDGFVLAGVRERLSPNDASTRGWPVGLVVSLVINLLLAQVLLYFALR